MELPTYTSIWRIEKRLYKLYDFRLPMPLPVGQIAVFTAITVPYVILLTLFGLPFSHTLFWLYVLPPGVLTWLATRPVLESKRLPELIISQVRYIGEPSAWCRMTPHVEKDEMRRDRAGVAAQPAPAGRGTGRAPCPRRPGPCRAVEPAAVPVVARPGERAGRRPAPAPARAWPGAGPGRRGSGPGRRCGAGRRAGAGRPGSWRRARPGGANGHGSAPAAFGASGRSTPPAPAPAKTPAPAGPPAAAGASAPAVAAPATPAAPASAPASAAPSVGRAPAPPALAAGRRGRCRARHLRLRPATPATASAPPRSARARPALLPPVPRRRPFLLPPVLRLRPVPRHPLTPRLPPVLRHMPAPAARPAPRTPAQPSGRRRCLAAVLAARPAPCPGSAQAPAEPRPASSGTASAAARCPCRCSGNR